MAVLLIGAMVWIGRVGFAGVALTPFATLVPPGTTAAENPALATCLSDRLDAVDGMLRDGVVSKQQYDTFRVRAISYCEAQFPPER